MTMDKIARKTSNMFSYIAVAIFILASGHPCTDLLYGNRISAYFVDYCQQGNFGQDVKHRFGVFYDCGEPAGLCICKDHTAHCDISSQALPVLPDDIYILDLCNSYFGYERGRTIKLSPHFFGKLKNVTELHIPAVNVMPATFDLLANIKTLSIDCGIIQPSLNDSLRTMLNYFSIPNLRSLTLFRCSCNISLPSITYSHIMQSQLRSLTVYSCNSETHNITLDLSRITSFKDLQRISFTECGIGYFVPTELPALEELILDNNLLKSFPQTCKSDMDNSSFFPSLNRISLKMNFIPVIGGSGATACLPKVTEIDVSENIIYLIQNGVFDAQSSPKLENITISFRTDVQIDMFPATLTEDFVFANPSIKILNLTNAHWRFPNCHFVNVVLNCVNPNIFANSSLTHLILDGNDFQNVSPDLLLELFGNIRNLVHLSIRNCQFTIPINFLICNLHLDYLDVSAQVGYQCTYDLALITDRLLRNKNKKCRNKIKIYKADNIAMMNELDDSEAFHMCNTIYKGIVFHLKSLVSSELTQFSFRHNGFNFGSMLCLRYISVQNIIDTVIVPCVPSVFKPNLKVLLLDGNDFSAVDTKQFVSLFGKLTNLEHFSLSDCDIQFVSLEMFLNFPNLQYLDLSKNKLTTLSNMPFVVFPMLTTLYLHANALSVVPEGLLSPDQLRNMNKFTLYFNPLVCSCDNRWLQSWILSRPEVFDFMSPNDNVESLILFRRKSYSCADVPSRSVANYTMPDQACMLGKETSIALIITCTVIIAMLTLFTLLFRYRWHFNLFLYYALSGRGKHKRRRRNYVFDVFVSYDQGDHPWIRQHLMPMLEERQGLQLCIHERDFIPGRYIVTNISQAVEHSKKILMVFSRSFVVSQWCQFEMDFCLSHVIENRESLLIVCLDDVTSDEAALTGAMKAALTTMTYIQWVDQPDAIHFFWERIRQSLHEVRPRRQQPQHQPQQERDDQAIIEYIELARWDV